MTEYEKVKKKGIVSEDFFKEEIICDYKVSERLKKLWSIELDLLAEFKRVCDKHSLKWYASSGTLLGAIRHGGFIPWDDDLDVCMPREDYDKLTKLYADEFKQPYFLQTPYTDEDYCYSFAKLRNTNTSFAVEAFIESSMNQGIFFDIFPLENSSEQGYRDRRNQIVDTLQKCSAYMSRKNKFVKNKHTELAEKINFKDGDNVKLYEKIQNIATSSNKENCEYRSTEVVTIYAPERKLWPKRCFEKCIEVPFCNTTINVPSGYDEILKITYGEYMKFPPVEKRGVWHDSKFVDVDVSYKIIKQKYLQQLKESKEV